MNLAGDNTKRLLRSLRTGGRPTSIGLWAAATAVEQLRKRRRPEKALLLRKDLEPGATYVVRVPQNDQPSMTETLSSGGLGSELMTAAAEFFTTEQAPPEAPEAPEEAQPTRLSRGGRRRARRIEKLEQGAVDLDAVPRRQRRVLQKAEARAHRRPKRRRVKKARRLQKAAGKTIAKAEKKAAPSKRRARKAQKASSQQELQKRPRRRARRKLAKAEKRQEQESAEHLSRRARRKLAKAEERSDTPEA